MEPGWAGRAGAVGPFQCVRPFGQLALHAGAYPITVTVTDTRDNITANSVENVSQRPLNQSETTVAIPSRVSAHWHLPTSTGTTGSTWW
jgi:hypothetical protein